MKVDTFKIINLGNHGVSQESILFRAYSIKENHSVSEPTTFIWVQYLPPDISVGAVEMDLKELSGSYVKAQSQGEILSWVPVVSSGSAGKFSVRAAWKFSHWCDSSAKGRYPLLHWWDLSLPSLLIRTLIISLLMAGNSKEIWYYMFYRDHPCLICH